MNEHIKEHASNFFDVNRHGYIVSPVDGYEIIEEELQKFAELIIKDCIDACYKANEIRNIVPPSQEQVVRWCIDEIERKFGIKS